MVRQNNRKLNQLLKSWPKGTVAVYAWLKKQGISRQLMDAYQKNDWVERIGRGAFVLASDKVDWTGGVYAIQEHMGLTIHPGGKAALQMQGFAHFLPLWTAGSVVWLFGVQGEQLPAWFSQHDWEIKHQYVATNLFPEKPAIGLTKTSMGSYDLTVSSMERAMMELLHLVPQRESFDEARLLMEGLATLRPKLVQSLLEVCRSIKVKRLFMFLAEEVNHQWVNKLDLSGVDFGKGKRVVVKGGCLDQKYQITVPRTYSPLPPFGMKP